MILFEPLDPSLSYACLEQLLNIEKACFSSVWSEQQIQQQLSNTHSLNFALYSQQQMVGFIFFKALFEDAEILQIAIKPSHQNEGFGQLLIEQSLAFMKSLKRTQPIERILLEVRSSNTPAIHLYKKIGFSLDGVRKNYYPAENKGEVKEDAHLYSVNV